MGATDNLILTPNARLARALQQAHIESQVADGLDVWASAAIAPVNVWLQRLQAELFINHHPVARPLSQAQARLIWMHFIASEVYVGQAGLARMAQQAWRVIHEHCLPLPDQWASGFLNEDQRAFQRWAQQYQDHCQTHRCEDFACFLSSLPERLATGWVCLPDSITLHGFGLEMTPIHKAIFAAMAQAGVDIVEDPPAYSSSLDGWVLHSCPSLHDEILHAGLWAREHLKDHPNQRVAIVVPRLDETLDSVEKHLKSIFDPPAMCLDEPGPATWHISLGHPLSQTPLVAEALGILALNPHRISQPDLARLLRSPWLKGWALEADERYQLILWLNDREPYWLDFGTVIRRAKSLACKELTRALSRWHSARLSSPPTATSDRWAEQFQEELSALGFGFGRTLDRVEYQTLQHWHQVLEQLGSLQAVNIAQTLEGDRASALDQLHALSAEVLFREQDLGAPVSVVGVQEALGSQWDAAWLIGLDHETWPAAPRRDPLIPGALQTAIPSATPEGCLELARQQLSGLLTIAPSIRGSYSLGDEALPLKPTRLLAEHVSLNNPLTRPSACAFATNPVTLEVVPNDHHARPIDETLTRGGVHLLNAQSACPFKAFAVYRLKARDHREPRPGISAKDRGTLVHDILQSFWEHTQHSDGLMALDDEALTASVHRLATEHLTVFIDQHPKALDSTGQRLELENLVRKITQWLMLERARPPFTAEHLEEPVALTMGPLTLEGKPDRIDRLEDGSTLVIDYKTGRTSKSDWTPIDRLRDGQLPAYALTVSPPPKAIAFAKISKDEIRFDGFSAEPIDIQGIQAIDRYNKAPFASVGGWRDLLDIWQGQLSDLATDYQQGQARVDPAKPAVCLYCHLKPLCRIQERSGWLGDTDDEPIEAGFSDD